MAFQKPSLTARALRLLSQREHSRLELERKLAPHVDAEQGDDLGAVLDGLEAKGFINPERVAQSVLYRRAAKLGRGRVLQELRQKGLDEELVQAASEQLKASEHQRAWQVWQRKFGQLATTPQEKAKQMRFLASRGFDADVLRRVVQGIAPEEDD
ncbi:MAG: recombination regulator RecX [Comamonas sp.]|nr:recombination regulator RecX [Comamonas sp.]